MKILQMAAVAAFGLLSPAHSTQYRSAPQLVSRLQVAISSLLLQIAEPR